MSSPAQREDCPQYFERHRAECVGLRPLEARPMLRFGALYPKAPAMYSHQDSDTVVSRPHLRPPAPLAFRPKRTPAARPGRAAQANTDNVPPDRAARDIRPTSTAFGAETMVSFAEPIARLRAVNARLQALVSSVAADESRRAEVQESSRAEGQPTRNGDEESDVQAMERRLLEAYVHMSMESEGRVL